MPQRVAKKTLYLNADKSKFVNEDDPDAAFLFVRAGSAVNESEYARLDGLGVNMKAVTSDDTDDFDARTEHDALHAGETDEQARSKRAALGTKAVKGPTEDKAKRSAPENK